MKVDIDDLERKARVATLQSWETWETIAVVGRMPEYCSGFAIVNTDSGQQVADAFDNTVWSDEQCVANASHIAANSPPVTLALVARIRELEAQAHRTIEATGLTVEDELWTLSKLLEKGAVIA
jgi:hypothetical protein